MQFANVKYKMQKQLHAGKIGKLKCANQKWSKKCIHTDSNLRIADQQRYHAVDNLNPDEYLILSCSTLIGKIHADWKYFVQFKHTDKSLDACLFPIF